MIVIFVLSCSLYIKGVFICELRQFVAFDDLETRVATQDLVESVSDTFLCKSVLILQESLLLARVQNNHAWYFSFLKVKDRGEVWFSADVKAHEVENNATLYLTCECLLYSC